MSIVDALERAKEMGKARRSTDASHADAQPVAPHRPPPAVVTEPRPSLEAVNFARVDYDLDTCARNHIIVPDVEPRLSQIASPSYRMLRTRLLQRCRTSGWSSLAITSPGPGEGKSVTCINIAINIAREGHYDVFLVDLDMRNPSVCLYLGVKPPAEITGFFKGQTAPEDMFFTIGIDRLTVAGGTSSTNTASELLATDRFEDLLKYIRRVSSNPMIIIDLPPVVSTDDALVLAPKVDATVLVVSEGRTRRDGLERAISLLADFPVAGVVLNRTHESIGSEYYGGAYT